MVLFIVLTLIGVVVWDRLLLPQGDTPSQSNNRQIVNWDQLQLNGYRIGRLDAPVQIIEFFDYQWGMNPNFVPVKGLIVLILG